MTDIDTAAEAMWRAAKGPVLYAHPGSYRPDAAWADVYEDYKAHYRLLAQAAIDALGLKAEFGWDIPGRRKPNPRPIYGNDGRPVISQPKLSDHVRLYERRTSPWVRVEEQS